MVGTDNDTVFIAGYQDLTEEEFNSNYKAKLDEEVARNSSFILSDEPGTCLRVYNYLFSRDVSRSRVSIYTNEVNETSTVHLPTDMNTTIHRIAGGDYERYLEMSEQSDRRIIWLRDGDGLRDHGCISAANAVNMRFTGAKEAQRAVVSKSMRRAMAYYDTIV